MDPNDSRPTPTKELALKHILDEFHRLRSNIEDQKVVEVLTDKLLTSVFEGAWNAQFELDRTTFTKRLQERISDSVAEHYL